MVVFGGKMDIIKYKAGKLNSMICAVDKGVMLNDIWVVVTAS